jgi:hypothetical protein
MILIRSLERVRRLTNHPSNDALEHVPVFAERSSWCKRAVFRNAFARSVKVTTMAFGVRSGSEPLSKSKLV